jgi:hypothetical protein
VTLYARVNRAGTHVVCFDHACGGRFGTIERAGGTFMLSTMEVGGPMTGHRVIAAGELYVELLPGFMAPDGVWRVPRARREYWRSRGLPPSPRSAHGRERALPELPARAECLECERVQVLEAGRLGIARPTSTR